MRQLLSSLRVRLVILVLIAALPAFGLILWASFDQRHSERSHAEEHATSLAQVVAGQQGQFVEGTRQLLGVLAGLSAQSINSGAGRPVDPVSCGRAFAGVLAQDQRYANMGIIGVDGTVVCSGLPSSTPVSVTDRSWYQEAIATKQFSVGQYQVGKITGQQTINFGYPVVDSGGTVRAVLFAAVDLDWLNGEAAKTKLPNGAALRILDRGGTYLVRYPNPERYVGITVLDQAQLQTAFAEGGSLVEDRGPDGVERLYASASVVTDAQR